MAINTKKIKLKTVLLNNKKWPLIIAGGAAADFDAPVMPANVEERDLNMGQWVSELVTLKSDKMVIDGLDKLKADAQSKFIRLLKDRRAGLYKLSDDIQIIIPVKSADKISNEIKKLCLIYNV